MQSLLDSLDGVGKFCYVEVSVFRGPWSSHGYSINAPINIETQLIGMWVYFIATIFDEVIHSFFQESSPLNASGNVTYTVHICQFPLCCV